MSCSGQRRIGFLAHPGRPQAVDIAKKAALWLEERGHIAVLLAEPSPRAGAAQAHGETDELDGLDLLVSLGGDGTMLRAVGKVVAKGIPVLGVNFGRLGYLTSVEPDGLHGGLERFLAGDYVLEHRMTVDAMVLPEGSRTSRLQATALNDVVLARPSGAHTVRLRSSIAGRHFLSHTADAMIVSTATGSTAYNLAVRGPIVSPKLRCLILTPVSPHMLFDRSLVLDSSDEVSLRVEGTWAPELIIDGSARGQVAVGERVVCQEGRHDALLVGFGDHSFETVLKSKFHLSDR